MAARNNHSSIRYSDEVKEAVDKMQGNTFGDKFENMVLTYSSSEEKLLSRLKRIERQILEKQEQLHSLSSKCQGLLRLNDDFNWMNSKLESIKNQVENIAK